VLRRIFGLKWDEEKGGWTNCIFGVFNNLYPSPDTSRTMKLREMRCAGRVARMGR
jgi:hypothetical protein